MDSPEYQRHRNQTYSNVGVRHTSIGSEITELGGSLGPFRRQNGLYEYGATEGNYQIHEPTGDKVRVSFERSSPGLQRQFAPLHDPCIQPLAVERPGWSCIGTSPPLNPLYHPPLQCRPAETKTPRWDLVRD